MTALTDDLLGAYVDGELDDDTAREVEQALTGDPLAREKVETLRATTAAVRAAFAEPLHHPVPDSLTDAVHRAAAARRSGGAGGGWRPALAIAASLAILAIGVGGGFWGADMRIRQADARLEQARLRYEAAIRQTVNRTLEHERSGTTVRWQDPDGMGSVAVTPVRTYRDRRGGFCREYVEKTHFDGQSRTHTALSCRKGAGDWITRFIIPRTTRGAS